MQASLRYLAEEVNRWHQALKIDQQVKHSRFSFFQNVFSFCTIISYQKSIWQQFPDLQLGRGPVSRIIRFTGKRNCIHYLKSNYELHQEYDFFEIRKKSVKSRMTNPFLLLEFGNIFDIANYKLSFGQPLVRGKCRNSFCFTRNSHLNQEGERKEITCLLMATIKIKTVVYQP